MPNVQYCLFRADWQRKTITQSLLPSRKRFFPASRRVHVSSGHNSRLQKKSTTLKMTCCCRSSDAEAMLGQAWRTMKQCFGSLHPKLANLLVDMAAMKAHQNRTTEAQHLMRRSIAMWRHMGAGSHPALLAALDTLANLCRAHGRSPCTAPGYLMAVWYRHVGTNEGQPNLLPFICCSVFTY